MLAVLFHFLSNYNSSYHILYICLFWVKGHGSVTSAVREKKGNHLLCVKRGKRNCSVYLLKEMLDFGLSAKN